MVSPLDGAGRVQLAVVDTAGQVWTALQAQPNTDSWPTFARQPTDGDVVVGEVALTQNQNGTLQMIATDGLGEVFQRTETSVGSNTWPVWTRLADKTLYHIAAATSPISHTILAAGSDADGNIWQATQTAPNATTYTGWTQIDGQLRR